MTKINKNNTKINLPPPPPPYSSYLKLCIGGYVVKLMLFRKPPKLVLPYIYQHIVVGRWGEVNPPRKKEFSGLGAHLRLNGAGGHPKHIYVLKFLEKSEAE